MVCLHCGKENEEGRKSCKHCGYPVHRVEDVIGFSRPDAEYIGPKVLAHPEDEEDTSQLINQRNGNAVNRQQDSANRPGLDYKRLLITVVSFAIIILAASIFYWNIQKDAAAFHYITEDALEVFVDESNDLTIIFNTRGERLFEIDEAMNVLYTVDGTAVILYNPSSSSMYYVNANEIKELPENISGLHYSEDGNFLIYSTNHATNSDESKLYWYDVKNKEEVVLDQGKQFTGLRISPDGKSIAYLASKDLTNYYRFGDMESYLIRDGGEPEYFGESRIVYTLSNDAEFIYYVEITNDNHFSFYVKKEGQSTLLGDSVQFVLFNQDYSELLFLHDQSTYLWNADTGKIKIHDSVPRNIIVPKRCQFNLVSNFSIGFDSFEKKAVIFQDDSVVWIGEGYEPMQVGEKADHYFAIHSTKEDTLMFGTRDYKIQKVTVLSELYNTETYIDRAEKIVASNDLENIYFIDRGKLYFKDGQKEPNLLAYHISDIYLNAKGDTAFFLKTKSGNHNVKTLHYSIRGSEPVAIEDGQDIAWLGQWNYGIVYGKKVGYNQYDIYYNTNGTEFKRILTNASYEAMVNGGILYYNSIQDANFY